MLMSYQEYMNQKQAAEVKEMFGPHGDMHDPDKAPIDATTYFSNARFAPGLRPKLTKIAAKKKLRGKML